jgi:DNA-directed RNA polymerase subunit RPC12/RpoP
MPNPTANASVDFVCRKCAHSFQKTLGSLQGHEDVSCPACGLPVNLENFNRREIEHTTRGLDAIRATLDDPLDLPTDTETGETI